MSKKKLDHLTRDVLAAEQAGMSYGQWKAKHPHTGDQDDDTPQEEPLDDSMEERVCVHCGKIFVAAKARKNKKFCCEEHQLAYNREKAKQRKPPKPSPGRPAACANCGGDFISIRGSKYCCVDCYTEAVRRQTAERNRKKREARANGCT